MVVFIFFFTFFVIFLAKDYFHRNFNLITKDYYVFFRLFLVFFFLFLFFFLLRLLIFFYPRVPVDLNKLLSFLTINNIMFFLLLLILVFVYFLNLYSMIVFFFKYSFLKCHLFFLNKEKFNHSLTYIKIINFLTSWNIRVVYFFFKKKINILPYTKKIYFFFKFFPDFLFFLCFFLDFFFFEKVMVLCFYYTPYYGIYKFFFNLNYFFIFDVDLIRDVLISHEIYNKSNGLIIFHPRNFYLENEFFDNMIYIHKKILNGYLLEKKNNDAEK